MDNDNKIDNNGTKKIQRHDEVLLFLDEELKSLKKGSNKDAYDIKKEYAKTKKNKSPFTLLVLLATTVILVAAAFVMTKLISKQNQEITVNLEEFDSLNLKNLLDTVFKTQSDYDSAVKNKVSLEAEQARLIKEAEAKRDNDLFVLGTLKLSRSAYNDRAKNINSECTAAISAIKADYAAQIAEVDAQIEVFQKQLAEFDNSKVKQAQEQEKALNSERQLRQLENREMTDKYEAKIADLQNSMDKLRVKNQEDIRKSVTEVQEKYQAEIDKLDPVLTDGKAGEIVRSVNAIPSGGMSLAGTSDVEDEALASAMHVYQKYQTDYEYLNKQIASVPQKNTIPSYVSANRKLVTQMGVTFTNTTKDLYRKNIQLQNKIVENKNKDAEIFTNLLTAAKSNALIYSAESVENIQIFIAERAQYLVDANNGIGAEFYIGKVVVKGRIYLDEDGVYRFNTGKDVDGNIVPLPVELSEVVPGTLVKLINK